MRFLITGANGFIGSSLALKLKKEIIDAEITLVDLKFDKDTILENDFDLIHGNLIDLKISELPKVDVVFHAAALLGVDFVNSNPGSVVIENIASFQPLKSYIDQDEVKFVFFSTSEVYGDGYDPVSGVNLPNSTAVALKLPNLKENRSSYALSKIVGEFISSRSLNHINLRPHNIYGTSMGNRHVIPNLIEKICNLSHNEKLKLFNPSHVRSFCYVDDAIDQIIYLIKNDKAGSYNIGNPNEPISMAKLAENLLYKLGKRVDIETNSETLGSPSFRRPEIDYIDKDYICLDDGLNKMIQSFNESQSWNT